jgi:Ser/Thr protein kinase RdoA (MazF antagonist)
MGSLEKVLSAYDIDMGSAQIEPINKGLINATWKIKTNEQDYILQKINHFVFKNPGAIASNVRLLEDYLKKHFPQYSFAAFIKTNSGKEMVITTEKEYFRLGFFVANSHTIATVEKPEQAFEAAKKFGEFTRLLSGFPVENLQITLPDFHNLTLRYEQFLNSLQNGNPARIKEAATLIDQSKANKNIVDTYEKILRDPDFKLRVTHHDTKISNVLFDDDDKGICLIDLDTVMPGYFISDVGDMLRTYLSPANEEEKDFSKIEIRHDYYSAIWKGYMSEMKNELNPAEKNHFLYSGKFMIYMQALRFLTDHLNNDIYYGAKYDGQNFVRAGNQIALLQRLIEKEEGLLRVMNK